MQDQTAKARDFRARHRAGQPLILFNAWDAGSAVAVERSGAAAIATGSWSVAAANGYPDGEALPLELALANLERIARAVALPVTLDLERGYGAGPDEVQASAMQAIRAGAVGCNLEDGLEGGTLRGIEAQAARIRAVRAAADALLPDFYINARTDLFLGSDPASHAGFADEALARASAYAEAGADCLFVPGLGNEALIAKLAEASPLPLNIMADGGTPPVARLAALGVARVSYGPQPYLLAMRALEQAAKEAQNWR
ncbi:isocitrate lyase/PEP mutase family protein [Massilia endophytica]|uniref:isocitrate lyase/PEP mutase family protein n=1 Tax=Massilia endophytica TaxID=2899220 RepID=UPI001E433EAA|nr:isocitrate lyase/phosphoenolpyruvate mutase family protein [Massilia endophytica]UGQ46879.1 isocitrate lyase/phosphoenolpyruvate mutase family protein [Massilia endophytica]